MGRFVPITVNTIAGAERPEQFCVAGGKGYYDGKQCWQYKVVYDRPGTYTYTLPVGVTCARTVLVGGGGKPKCTFDNCCSSGGAGGAYSEKCMTVTGDTTQFTIVVGRQEQDTTLACNSVAVHTAGGAAGCIPGAATGGDWNSRGGCSAFSCNYCGGSFSQACGSCICFNVTNCCGYCIVYASKPGPNGGSTCCNILLSGGASAGSPRALCGGMPSCLCGNCFSGVSGGGAGIGNITGSSVPWHYPCCSCLCTAYCTGWQFSTDYPTSAEGGGGSGTNTKHTGCRSWNGDCMGGTWKAGPGGQGGPEGNTTNGFSIEWGFHQICAYPYGSGYCIPEVMERPPGHAPCRVDWWDISTICGNGSPGTMGEQTGGGCEQRQGVAFGQRPDNAGEGAGTGGISSYYCCTCYFGNGIAMDNGSLGPQLNWDKICQLGCCGQTEQAWLMQDSLFPMFITCAGTLGGSGGVSWGGYTSKAGKGGGGGQAKCHLLCVCHGGNFDRCNNSGANPLLAFPPCLLDQMVSNAGTGMAIIYYREA